MLAELRDVSLRGVYNVRDLGGLPTSDGNTTRRGVFLRGDSPHHLTSSAQDTLVQQYQVQTVIDLRSTRELMQLPNPFGQDNRVQYVSVPLHTTGLRMLDVRQLTHLHLYYQYLIRTGRTQLRTVFETLADAPAATYFHCRIGKDRTGIVTALLLQLADVSIDVIIDDYLQTTANIVPLIAQYAHERPFFIRKTLYEGLFEARAETMIHLLRYVQDAYGGAEGYLCHLGVNAVRVAALRQKLTKSRSA
ncbi:MAG: tyrosine-protein phosphatase [Roseiflexaceae bacterium]